MLSRPRRRRRCAARDATRDVECQRTRGTTATCRGRDGGRDVQRPPRRAAKCSRSAFAVLARNARAAPGKLSVSRAGVEGFHFRGAPRLDRPAGRTAGGAARESKTLRRKGTGPLARTCHAERPRPRQRLHPPAQVKICARQFAAIWENESGGVRRGVARPDDGKADTARRDALRVEQDDQAAHRGSWNSEPFGRPAPSGDRALRSPSARSRSVWLVRRETRAEPVLSGRAVASGGEAGGGVAALVAVEEGVGAGGSAARPPVSRPEPARARSWRVVGLGRRVARGGRERETKPSPTAANTSARTTVPAPQRRVHPLAVAADIVRPSLLLGDRRKLGQPVRRGESLAALIMQALRLILPRNYRPIPAEKVARALLATVAAAKGVHIVSSAEMQDY